VEAGLQPRVLWSISARASLSISTDPNDYQVAAGMTPIAAGRLMKYLCLVYLDGEKLRAVPDRECLACGEGFRASGLLVAAEALQPIETATTVRVRNGKLSVTDGPFAETKEQLAGFYLIEARDLNEAIQVAARIPPAREGSVEVRPVRELDAT
jgi:hypothetical protein